MFRRLRMAEVLVHLKYCAGPIGATRASLFKKDSFSWLLVLDVGGNPSRHRGEPSLRMIMELDDIHR